MIKKNNNLVDYGKEDVEFIARESLYKGFFPWIFTASVTVCLTAR